MGATSLLDIPEEVIYGHLLQHFKLPDLLRFRRVCKLIKLVVDEYFNKDKYNPSTQNEVWIEINEAGRTFSRLFHLPISLPMTHVYIKNTGAGIYNDNAVGEFLKKYGKVVTHLRVHIFSTFISSKELHFYATLTNLQYLEMDEVDASKRDCRGGSSRKKSPFPNNFQKLKTLKLGLIHRSHTDDTFYPWELMEACDQVEYMGHPIFKHVHYGNEGQALHRGGSFGCVMDIIRKRKNGHKDNLKFYDMENFEDDLRYPSIFSFMRLSETCYKSNTKLMNVDACLFACISPLVRNHYETFSNPIHSSRNVHAAMLLTEMPYLEKLLITGTSRCSFADEWNNRPKWPSLRELHLNVDSKNLAQIQGMTEESKKLVDFLFNKGIVRENLRELSLHFRDTLNIVQYYCPRSAAVVHSCPNITKLSIKTWQGTNKAMCKLWAGLPHLEEVIIDTCTNVGNVAFVWESLENPIFLKLKKLRKLSFKALDRMDKITDTLFIHVIRHLPLTHLTIEAKRPIEGVTEVGVRALLTGEFANTIEKFPFKGFTVRCVPSMVLKEIEMSFRSSQM